MMRDRKPIAVGLVGIGGYARHHINALSTLRNAGICQLVAACDPFADRDPALQRALQAQGVEIFADRDRFLSRDDISAVFIATPIHLHAPYAIAALAVGKSVYLEKPPCATLSELDAIISALEKVRQSKGVVPIARVGFQMQTSPSLRWVKRQLVSNVWGRLQTVSASVRWPRNDAYYARSSWAAKWELDGHPIFDGPATNALSHVVFAALFCCGQTESEIAAPLRVRGSLLRARAIESYDCALLEAQMPNGVDLRLAFSHATACNDVAAIHLHCESARITLNWNNDVHVARHDAPPETLSFLHSPGIAGIGDFLCALQSGEGGLLPALEETRPYIALTCGALQSSGGSSPFPSTHSYGEGDARVCIADGLDEQMQRFADAVGSIPPAFGIESKPWVEQKDILHQLAIGRTKPDHSRRL